MSDFAGKRIVVTGAAGAIGSICVARLLAGGARVDAVDRDRAALDRLADSCRGDRLRTVVSDLATPGACRAALGDGGPAIFALIHMVGVYDRDDCSAESRATWDTALHANLTTAFDMAGAFVPHKTADEAARLVFLGSVAAEIGSRDHIAYSAAKAGLKGLAHALARQLAPSVLVNTIAPGMVESPMGRAVIEERGPQMLAATPLGRFAMPEDIASVVEFLCTGGAAYITGQTIHVNGGAVMT